MSDSIVEKYGGKEYLEAPPKELLLATTEEYVEYSRTGKIIKGLIILYSNINIMRFIF